MIRRRALRRRTWVRDTVRARRALGLALPVDPTQYAFYLSPEEAERRARAAAERERLLLRLTGFVGLVVLALFVAGCPDDPQPQGQVNQFPQTPAGGAAQPCPNSDVVEVEILDEQIGVPVKNLTVTVRYSDGTTQPVVTDQNGIASVCVRPGQTFTVEVPDIHSLPRETHTPR